MGTLSSLVIVPVIGALIVAITPRTRVDLLRAVSGVTSAAVVSISGYIFWNFDRDSDGYQFVVNQPWISEFGISFHFGIDGISLLLVALTAILFPIAIFGPPIKHDPKPYLAWLLVLEAGVMGSFIALDLIVFFIFFELVLVPMYFLISGWGYSERAYAAVKFFVYTLFGSAFLLVGILSLAALHHSATGIWTFDALQLAGGAGLNKTSGMLLFFAFGIGFAVKVPIFPLHTWLPDAHTQAPTAGSVVLAGVLLKMGTYGFLRFSLGLFPQESVRFAPLMMTLAVIGITYAAIVATMQKDLKRLIAYSSVAHLGFIVLGIFAINSQGLTGGALQMINHGVSTGALFLLVGMISDRLHTREISKLRGISKSAPILGGVFLIVVFSSIGVPGFNGFIGEFSILLGAFEAHRWWAIAAATGVVFAALYLLWGYQRSFHGEPNELTSKMSDLNLGEKLQLAPLLVLIVLFGVYPKPFIERLEPSVERVVEHVEQAKPYVVTTTTTTTTIPQLIQPDETITVGPN